MPNTDAAAWCQGHLTPHASPCIPRSTYKSMGEGGLRFIVSFSRALLLRRIAQFAGRSQHPRRFVAIDPAEFTLGKVFDEARPHEYVVFARVDDELRRHS